MERMSESVLAPVGTDRNARSPALSPRGGDGLDRGLLLLGALAVYVASYMALVAHVPAARERRLVPKRPRIPARRADGRASCRARRPRGAARCGHAPRLAAGRRGAPLLLARGPSLVRLRLDLAASRRAREPRATPRDRSPTSPTTCRFCSACCRFRASCARAPNRRQFWLDVATVFLGGLMVLWSVLIAPLADLETPATRRPGSFRRLPDGRSRPALRDVGRRGRRRREEAARSSCSPDGGLTATLRQRLDLSILCLTSAYQSGTTVDMISMIAWLLVRRERGRPAAASPGRPTAADPGTRPRPTMSLAPYVAVVWDTARSSSRRSRPARLRRSAGSSSEPSR